MSVLRTVGLALALCLACLFPLQAAAKNMALIVGNGDYRNVARLPKPTNDAALAVSTFSASGFQTSVILNDDAAEMRRANFSARSPSLRSPRTPAASAVFLTRRATS